MFSNEFNIYCDESCHLENDNSKVMVLGGIICPQTEKSNVFNDIKNIKNNHKLKYYEMKWTKISKAKMDFYKEIIHYFFASKVLRFRGLIIPDKNILNHEKFNQTHDKFYYKMYYDLLNTVTRPPHNYNIYIDIKDTQGYLKIKELKRFLSPTVNKIQEVRSEEVELIQLADLIIGANSYYCNNFSSSDAKLEIVNLINRYCNEYNNSNMDATTNYCAFKYNLLNINLSGDFECE